MTERIWLAFRAFWGVVAGICVVFEGVLDAAVPELLVAVDAARVDPPEDLYAVPGTAGHFGGGDAGVEGQGDAAVPQVVGASGEW